MKDWKEKAIDNTEDVIDSRQVVARVEYLRELEEPDEDEKDELVMLTVLMEQELPGDKWEDGAALVRDDHFKEYAEQFAEDLGLIATSVQWPYTCIDWEQAARELRVDYTSIDFNGVTYWVR